MVLPPPYCWVSAGILLCIRLNQQGIITKHFVCFFTESFLHYWLSSWGQGCPPTQIQNQKSMPNIFFAKEDLGNVVVNMYKLTKLEQFFCKGKKFTSELNTLVDRPIEYISQLTEVESALKLLLEEKQALHQLTYKWL